MVKKPRRQAPTVVVEGEPSAAISPPAPLATELSAPKPTTGEAALDPGKISFVLAIHFMRSGQLIICFVIQAPRR